MSRSSTIALIATLVAAALPVTGARAVLIERQEVRLSADVCQPALPAFDGQIRKRPLAMQNEGTANAFLTCSFGGVFNGVPSQKTVTVGLINNTAAPVSVNCTLVDGGVGLTNATYFPRTFQLQPGVTNLLRWEAVLHNNGTMFTYPSASCLVPPGVGINSTYHTFDEEIGA